MLIRRCCACKKEMGRIFEDDKQHRAVYTDGYCRMCLLRVLRKDKLATKAELRELAWLEEEYQQEEESLWAWWKCPIRW